MIPKDRFYTEEHEWIMIEDGVANIGITDHAQHELGDIVFVELPEVGAEFGAGDSVAVVESVKAVSNIYTQAAGKVSAVNQELEDAPERLNEAPYETRIFSLELSQYDKAKLLSAEQYAALTGEDA